jgi:hypothetical protein
MDENLEDFLFPEVSHADPHSDFPLERYDIPVFNQKKELLGEPSEKKKKPTRRTRIVTKKYRKRAIIFDKPTESEGSSSQYCPICGESTTDVKAHRRQFHLRSTCICDLCGKQFKWMSTLNVHLKVCFLTKFCTKYYMINS